MSGQSMLSDDTDHDFSSQRHQHELYMAQEQQLQQLPFPHNHPQHHQHQHHQHQHYHQHQQPQQHQIYPATNYDQPLMIMMPPQPIPNYIIQPQQYYAASSPTYNNWDNTHPSSQSMQPASQAPSAASAAAAAALAATNTASTTMPMFDPQAVEMNKKYQCHICHKYYRRDLPRHLRTHQATARFQCPYPRAQCPHKRGQFNRPYDYKKHLLHCHFTFDEQKRVRGFRDLRSKLSYWGTCGCGNRFLAEDWLATHIILGPGDPGRCSLLEFVEDIELPRSADGREI